MKQLLLSLLIYLLICLPLIVLSVPVVALLLLTKWDGKTTIFGNSKWGKGDTNPSYNKSGYLAALLWLVWRNPVNNLCTQYLAVKQAPYTVSGDTEIGDKIKGGFYKAQMGKAWEYYYIKPYGTRCIRARIGWKIVKNEQSKAAFVFTVNPFKIYLGK